MKKRRLHIFRLLLVILVPVVFLSACGFGLYQLFKPKEEVVVEKKPVHQPTIEALLKHSLEPIGTTMYVWGGGWNKEDTAGGKETKTIGLSPKWKEFASKQDATYDYNQYEYQIHDGLDCSGYIGWVVYNTMETKNNQTNYVKESGSILKYYKQKGFGKIIPAQDIKNYKPGDLLANSEHIYMVLGQYKDGSVLLVHSSPPGVRIAGTPDQEGDLDSQAITAAKKIMEREYPAWYHKYPDCMADISFLTDYDQFRWNSKTMKDAKKIQKLDARQIVHLLYD